MRAWKPADEVFDIGLNRGGDADRRRRSQRAPSGRRFGADPGQAARRASEALVAVAVKKRPLRARTSTAGGVNATIPSDKTPETITLARGHCADRRAHRQGRRQAEARRQEGCSEEGRAAEEGPRPRLPIPDAPKACQEGAAAKGKQQ